MPLGRNERGQSLIQLMLVVAILGIMGALLAKLTGKVSVAWLTNRTNSKMHYNAESVRRFLGSQMRDASIASVSISRTAVGQPVLSKISWVDFDGSSRTVYQSGTMLLSANWVSNPADVTKVATVLKEGLERFHAYYPNTKDSSKISFSLVLSKKIQANSATLAQLSVVCDVELKNP